MILILRAQNVYTCESKSVMDDMSTPRLTNCERARYHHTAETDEAREQRLARDRARSTQSEL